VGQWVLEFVFREFASRLVEYVLGRDLQTSEYPRVGSAFLPGRALHGSTFQIEVSARVLVLDRFGLEVTGYLSAVALDRSLVQLEHEEFPLA
jgi:hypothetical protein